VGNKSGYTLGMAKVMVSLKDDLLGEIDAEAERRHTTRSAFLALAATHELARRDSVTVQAAIMRSEQRFRAAGSFEAADLVRDDRDSRR
jgi:predicted transcriptional regulator